MRSCDYEKIFPGAATEEVFQEARRYVAALVQKALIRFPPALLPASSRPTCDFDPTVEPGISVEFSTAAFRFGHSMLPSMIKLPKDARFYKRLRQPQWTVLRKKISKLYGDWKKLDLFPGLLTEDTLFLPELGPTHARILNDAFARVCQIDPEFYTSTKKLTSFSRERSLK